MELQKIGQVIKEHRIEKGLSQTQFAEALHVTRQAVSKWENRKSIPDPGMFEAVSQLLEISVSELLSEETGKPGNDESTEATEAKAVQKEKTDSSARTVRIFLISVIILILTVALASVLSLNTGLNRWTISEFMIYFLPFIIFFCGLILVIAALIGRAVHRKLFFLLIPGILMMCYPLIVIARML